MADLSNHPAYEEGRSDWMVAGHDAMNPYPEGSVERSAWYAGWREARAEEVSNG